MKAINDEGQQLIYNSQNKLDENLKQLVSLIELILENIENFSLEKIKNMVEQARQVAFDSSRLSYLGVQGLKLKVLNENSDAEKHTKFTRISEQLYNIFSSLHGNFHKTEIKQNLIQILHAIEKI
jgi:hypothetical protein